MSNLDDMHENGVHDYLKYIKFGYGRCHRPRLQGHPRRPDEPRRRRIELVQRYDPVKPQRPRSAGSTTSA